MATFASFATTGGAHKHTWTNIQNLIHNTKFQMLVDVSSSLSSSSSCCSVTSLLRLKEVDTSDEGLYTCRPAGITGEDRVVLHILDPPVVEERMNIKLPMSDAAVIHHQVILLLLMKVSISSFLSD